LLKRNKIKFAVQAQQKGTAHALQCGLKPIKPKTGHLLVLNGDIPLIQTKTMKALLAVHKKVKAGISLFTAIVEDQMSFGRIVRDQKKQVAGVVEEKDATREQRKIKEVNVGIYAFDLGFLNKSINKVKNKNKQKEFYLPDLVEVARNEGLAVGDLKAKENWEIMGVNSRIHLCEVNHMFYKKQRERFMANGVSMIGDGIFIDKGVKISSDVTLHSPCYLKGKTKIASGTVVETGAVIKDSTIGEGSLIKAHTYMDLATVGKKCDIGPFAHLRPGSVLKDKVKVGNFVEVKKSVLGEGSKANHLSYLGDAQIGKKVNVGAGTITCNYDGYGKSKTVLEDGVFVGSDTQFVAPVRVKKGAYIGSGTTVTKDVKSNSLVISRVPQREIAGWATKYRKSRQKS